MSPAAKQVLGLMLVETHKDDRIGMAQLHYFKGRGCAETTRWMLAINQIAFENVTIETPEALSSLRATGKLPFDQLPLLEINEQK